MYYQDEEDGPAKPSQVTTDGLSFKAAAKDILQRFFLFFLNKI